jgi:hypothetical protein
MALNVVQGSAAHGDLCCNAGVLLVWLEGSETRTLHHCCLRKHFATEVSWYPTMWQVLKSVCNWQHCLYFSTFQLLYCMLNHNYLIFKQE